MARPSCAARTTRTPARRVQRHRHRLRHRQRGRPVRAAGLGRALRGDRGLRRHRRLRLQPGLGRSRPHWSENPAGTTLGFEHLKDEGKTARRWSPGPHHLHQGRRRLRPRRLQIGPRAAARLRRRHQRRRAHTASAASSSSRRTPTARSRSTSTAPCCRPARSATPSTARCRRSRTASRVAIEAGEKNVLAKDGSLLH